MARNSVKIFYHAKLSRSDCDPNDCPQNGKQNKGFTLIELMVVMSILALLSVIVLAAIQDARIKAQNKTRNSQALEYIKALELYKTNNPSEGYPSNRATTPSTNSYICLGNSTCQNNLINDSGLDGKLKEFIQPWIDNGSVMVSTDDMKGISYKCTDDPYVLGKCNQYSLQWFLVGVDQECVRGAFSENFLSVLTICRYPK